MALSARALLTLTGAKQRLFEDANDALSNAILEAMIDATSQLLEVEVGGPIAPQTYANERLDGDGTAEIMLPWRVRSVTSIEMRDSRDASVLTLSSSSEWFIVDGEAGIIRLKNHAFIPGRKNILFTGGVGFDSTDPRLTVCREACGIALADIWKRRQNQTMSMVNRTYPDGSASFIPAASIPPIARQMVAPFARVA